LGRGAAPAAESEQSCTLQGAGSGHQNNTHPSHTPSLARPPPSARQALNGLGIAASQAGAAGANVVGEAVTAPLLAKAKEVTAYQNALLSEAGKAVGSGIAAVTTATAPFRGFAPDALALEALLANTRALVAFLEVGGGGAWEAGAARPSGAVRARGGECAWRCMPRRPRAQRAPPTRTAPASPRATGPPRPATPQGVNDLSPAAKKVLLGPSIGALKVAGASLGAFKEVITGRTDLLTALGDAAAAALGPGGLLPSPGDITNVLGTAVGLITGLPLP
jgi:hypothetical protein